jgi:hypothetical protein
MGFLLHSDLLGFERAAGLSSERALETITELAAYACGAMRWRDMSSSEARRSGDIGYLFQDTLEYYSPDLEEVVRFSARVTWAMFMLPAKLGGPIGLRGTIVPCPEPPVFETPDHERLKSFVVIPKNIEKARAAESYHVAGARILVSPEVFSQDPLNEINSTWAPATRWLLFKIDCGSATESRGEDGHHPLILPRQLRESFDVAWMNTPIIDKDERGFEQCRRRFSQFLFSAIHDERTVHHSAATAALFEATAQFRGAASRLVRRQFRERGAALPTHDSDSLEYYRWLLAKIQARERRTGEKIEVATRVQIA